MTVPITGSQLVSKESMMTELSENFDWFEVTTTNHRNIDNSLPIELYQNVRLAAVWMEKVRKVLGSRPIIISSWYRSPELNVAVGGSNTSEHPKGTAIDFVCPKFGTPVDIVRKLSNLENKIYFNQLILEHTWVHISFPVPPAVPKMQVLSLLANKRYAVGITDKYGKAL